jgi:hypothetical protein
LPDESRQSFAGPHRLRCACLDEERFHLGGGGPPSRCELEPGAIVVWNPHLARDPAGFLADLSNHVRDRLLERLGGADQRGCRLQESELVFGLSQLRHVADGDDGSDTRFHRERRRRVGDRDHRAVSPEEPIVVDADALPRPPWLQKRTVLGRIGRAVRTLVVRCGVAVPTQQFRLVFVAEERHCSGIHEREVTVLVDDV